MGGDKELTNLGLVDFVKSKIGVPYVYGAKMELLTKDKYQSLKKQHGKNVWDSDSTKIGKICCDCSGLISAYTGIVRGSAQYKEMAAISHPISTVASAPIGALVWKDGHVGVYIGDNCYIAEDGSQYGCRKAKLPASFTHWFLCADIVYIKEETASANSAAAARNGANTDFVDTLLTACPGVISSPEYWKTQNIPYFEALIANVIPKLDSGVDNGISSLDEALDVLGRAGAVNTPDYWKRAAKSVRYLEELLVKLADKVRG
jgi:cell wall-associated NlpC family hydrolase